LKVAIRQYLRTGVRPTTRAYVFLRDCPGTRPERRRRLPRPVPVVGGTTAPPVRRLATIAAFAVLQFAAMWASFLPVIDRR
jgi:hypothetical protein